MAIKEHLEKRSGFRNVDIRIQVQLEETEAAARDRTVYNKWSVACAPLEATRYKSRKSQVKV